MAQAINLNEMVQIELAYAQRAVETKHHFDASRSLLLARSAVIVGEETGAIKPRERQEYLKLYDDLSTKIEEVYIH